MSLSKLTARTKAGGCASKLSPSILHQVLPKLPRRADPRLLVGFETSDDAGIYLLTEDYALVQTVDFFTPVVDDPYQFGAIAAANALSDVYAMGGVPLTALSILTFPSGGDLDELEQILRGGVDKIHEAGCVLAGGHSVADEEIKFGLAVTGTVHPKKIWTNGGARAGDVLVFTKRLGTGLIGTALKKGIASDEHAAEAAGSMLTLNKAAAEALRQVEVHACTDVTGFGLMGHGREMALASGVTLQFHFDALPLLPGALEYAASNAISGGLRNNHAFAESCVLYERGLGVDQTAILFDPQTSGGLLASIPEDQVGVLQKLFPSAVAIGVVKTRGEKPIHIV